MIYTLFFLFFFTVLGAYFLSIRIFSLISPNFHFYSPPLAIVFCKIYTPEMLSYSYALVPNLQPPIHIIWSLREKKGKVSWLNERYMQDGCFLDYDCMGSGGSAISWSLHLLCSNSRRISGVILWCCCILQRSSRAC